MNYRIEKDSMGEVKIPEDKYWGAQTERSKENFPIGSEKMPAEIIRAFAVLKKSAAKANYRLGLLSKPKTDAIQYAADKIINKELEDHFPLVVWQTGSGTQSHMNVNEVIAHVGTLWLEETGYDLNLHPNDDVNKSQSSNDTYPTAMHIAFILKLEDSVLPAISSLQTSLEEKMTAFEDIVKMGRTHLQDATPVTLGQEISGWHHMLDKSYRMIKTCMDELRDLAIGGTAVGTGLNAPPNFSETVTEIIAEETGTEFRSAPNKFHALTSHDDTVYVHGALKGLAADLTKIANDIRWLASGPRSGLGEIKIPANEPGSSIMPGKVNPTQAEALTMVTTQVMGNDTAIGFAASQGNFELNVFKPVIAYNFLQSCQLLADSMQSFNDRCVKGIEPNYEHIDKFLHQSLMLVTALNPYIGYEKAAAIAHEAFKDNTSLKTAAVKLEYLTEEEFDKIINPINMT